MSIRQFASDAAERAASTFVQTLVVVLFTASGQLISDPRWGVALLAGLIAAAVSVLTTLASIPMPALPATLDLLMRVAKTFLQSFVGALAVADYIHVNWAGALATAFPVALLALLKGLIALSVPGTVGGASLLKAPAAPAGQPGQSFADPARG